MTRKQRIHLMRDLWPGACRWQGWPPNDRARRLAEIGRALGRPVASSNEVRTNDDFDRVKKHLLTLALDVAAAAEDEHAGRARRLRRRIGEVIARIEDSRRAVTPDFDAGAFVQAIIADKFDHGRRREGLRLEELTAAPLVDAQGREHPSQLDQLLMTLTRCLYGS